MLEACVNSSLTYGCEAWLYGVNLHRKAIQMILGIRNTVPNHIIYIESGILPIDHLIKSQHLKYWIKINKCVQDNPISPIAQMFHISKQHNIQFIRYYEHLESEYLNPINCRDSLNKTFTESTKHKIKSTTDPDSPLGTYAIINPSLDTPLYHHSTVE